MKIRVIVTVAVFFLCNAFAQYKLPGSSDLEGGLGLTWIDGQPHYAFHLNPELAFANFGLGLDLNLEFDASGNLRKENFNETSDYLSIIRYLRYGMKNDPVYVQVGAIDWYTLGHGSIMYLYNNRPSIDNRKIGIVVDARTEKFGIESMYSDLSMSGVLALRAHINPIKLFGVSSVPFFSDLEVGASFATDLHKNAGIDSATYTPSKNIVKAITDHGHIKIVGLDVGLPLINGSFMGVTLYGDYVKIMDFGNGAASGIKFDFNGLGLVKANIKLERRWNSEKFLPNYFGTTYEIERYRLDTMKTPAVFESKVQMLKNATNPENGYFGSLQIDMMNMFSILGSYQRLDKAPESGILQLHTVVEPETFPCLVRAGYEKRNIKDEVDMFRLDDRSFAFAEVGYKPYPYLLVSLVYNFTFTPVRDPKNNDNVIGFAPQKKFEPRVSFVYPLNFGGKK